MKKIDCLPSFKKIMKILFEMPRFLLVKIVRFDERGKLKVSLVNKTNIVGLFFLHLCFRISFVFLLSFS